MDTRVIFATDGAGRVGVRTTALRPWGDCIGLDFMKEGEESWFSLSIAPARARILAYFLLNASEYKEKNDPGIKCIDKLD